MTTASPARLGPGYRLLGAILVSVLVVGLAYWLRDIGRLYTFSYGVSYAAVGTVTWQIGKKLQARRDRGATFGVFEPIAAPLRETAANLRARARGLAALRQLAVAGRFLALLAWSLVVIQGLQTLLVALFSQLVSVWLAVVLAAGMALVVLAWDVLLAWIGRNTTPAPADPVPAATQAGE